MADPGAGRSGAGADSAWRHDAAVAAADGRGGAGDGCSGMPTIGKGRVA